MGKKRADKLVSPDDFKEVQARQRQRFKEAYNAQVAAGLIDPNAYEEEEEDGDPCDPYYEHNKAVQLE